MVPRVSMAPMARPQPQPHSSNPATAKPTPTKSLLRRPALAGRVRSREDAGLDLDDDEMSAQPSPSKRARTVTFNPHVQQQTFTSSPEAIIDMEDIRRTVRKALEEHAKPSPDDSRYDNIKEVFSIKNKSKGKSDNDNTRAHLLALSGCVSLLGKSCSGLVKAILESEWIGREETYVKGYIHFLGHLVSAQGAYVGKVLSMLIGKFATGIPLSSGRLPDCPLVNRDQLYTRVHRALKYLLRLIPSASGTLSPILATRFPYADDSKKKHMTFIDNLVHIIDYAAELKAEIFALITERLVKIDVQMQVDLDDVDDDITAAIVRSIAVELETPTNAEISDDESDAESVSSEDSDDNEDDEKRVKKISENVEKMDAILDILFRLYTPYFDDPNSTVAFAMFDTLLSHFRNIILPTYRSRHTQFLLFHFAQTSEHLIDIFAGECVDLAFKSGRPAVLKQSAAAYLASFVSRGAHVSPHVVRDVFDYIGANLDMIRAENEITCRGPDLQRYSTFYATTQALLYIFCFRWRDLVVSPVNEDGEIDDEDIIGRDLEWRAGVKELLDRTIYSKLNPLKICAPSIVEEFAKIAHHLNFMYIYPLLATNKRIRLSQFALGTTAGSGGVLRDSGFANAKAAEEGEEERWHQLEAYFPFDPYQLPKSRKWVENDYVVWKGIPGLHDEDEDSSDEEEDDEDDEDEELTIDTATDDESMSR